MDKNSNSDYNIVCTEDGSNAKITESEFEPKLEYFVFETESETESLVTSSEMSKM